MKSRIAVLLLALVGAVTLAPSPSQTQTQVIQMQVQNGQGGGFGGARGMGGFDPGQIFDRFSNGQNVLIRSQLDQRGQMMFDRFAQQMGVTNGQITRDQFSAGMQQMMQSFGGGMGMRMGGAPGGGQMQIQFLQAGQKAAMLADPETDARAVADFQRRDSDGDGYLNPDEMPGRLRNELQTWDRDGNGLIDINEYKAWYRARQLARQQQQDQAGGYGPGPGGPPDGSVPPEDEDKKPVVYRAGNLPRELPSWFAEADTNQDGQVALYEWRAKAWPDREFFSMDSNNDGFLTVEEVLRYQLAQSKSAGTNPQVGAMMASGMGNPRPMGAGGPGAWPAMGGPGGWQGGRPGSNMPTFPGADMSQGRGRWGGGGSPFDPTGGNGFGRGRFGGPPTDGQNQGFDPNGRRRGNNQN
jgi:Ca2+-binding EF-hand superfamily protein